MDLRYGGSDGDHRSIEWPGSGPQPLKVYQHSANRCQVFGSMQSRCIFHDQVGIDLPPEILERSRNTGLTFVLRAKTGSGHDLALPGGYIEAFLRTVRQALAAQPRPAPARRGGLAAQ